MKKNEHYLEKRIKNSQNHQEKIWNSGINDLTITKEEKHRKIYTSSTTSYIDFMSCSYLGLETDNRLIKMVTDNLERFGVQYAAARTRAKCFVFDELERKLNQIFMSSNSVIFNSVGAAHLAVLPLLGSGVLPEYVIKQGGIVWIMEKHTHASIQMLRGILEQFGKVYRTNS